MKDVYAIYESKNGGDKQRSRWIRIGVAFDNKDGSLNGTRTRVSEILNRRRPLSIRMIRRLHDKLGISAEVLIRKTRTKSAA